MDDIHGLSTLDIKGLIKELKRREAIRTNNVIGDLDEYLVIETYQRNSNLAKFLFGAIRHAEYRCT